MRKIISLLVWLSLTMLSIAQTPDPPSGKVWVLKPEMSDEFGPGAVDESKWDIYDKANSWDRTAAFDRRVQEIQLDSSGEEENYVLAMNPMWYEEEDIFTKNGRTYYFAGGGMQTRVLGTYGYMEVRIKPSDFPMGSGVFMHTRQLTPGDCGESYHSELDIIENMSYTGPGASEWWNGYQHVNTHYKPTDELCNIPPSTQWGGSSRALEGPLDYNVVGAWWKNKDSVQFYLNGNHWHTIEYLEDSYMPMPLILTMETYTWGSDENNADNPKPEAYMFQDNFRTREERAVYYDWVRTWDLVDIDTAALNDSTDNIAFYEDPLRMYEDSLLDVTLLYSATEIREIAVSVFSSSWDLLGTDTLQSDTGVHSLFVSLQTDSILAAGTDYKAVCTLRPVGYDDEADLAKDTVQVIVETKAVETLVMDDGFPKQVFPSTTGYFLDVHYQGAENMEIAVEVRDPSGAWIGGGLQEVPDGAGIARIWAGLISPTQMGSGYYWKTHIRPRGTTWRESVHGLGFIPFQVVEEPLNELILSSEGWPYMDTVKSVPVNVAYSALESAELQVTLTREGVPVLDDTIIRVETGSGSLNVDLYFPSEPEPSDDYLLIALLHSGATDSLLVSDTLQNLEILETVDPVGQGRSKESVPGTLRVYPNPASKSLTVDLLSHTDQVESMYITDFSGRVLLQLNELQKTDPKAGYVVDISSLKPGYYILNCKANMASYSTGFIVE